MLRIPNAFIVYLSHFFFLFEMESLYRPHIKPQILLPQFPGSWNNRHAPRHQLSYQILRNVCRKNGEFEVETVAQWLSSYTTLVESWNLVDNTHNQWLTSSRRASDFHGHLHSCAQYLPSYMFTRLKIILKVNLN